MLKNLLEMVVDFIFIPVNMALGILPSSPLRMPDEIGSQFSEILGYINYFVPVGFFVSTTILYTTSALIYYGVRWLLRIGNYIQ